MRKATILIRRTGQKLSTIEGVKGGPHKTNGQLTGQVNN